MTSTSTTFTQIQEKINNQKILTRICVNKQTNNSFSISLQKIIVVWQMIHMNNKFFKNNIRTITERIEFCHLQYTLNYGTTEVKN